MSGVPYTFGTATTSIPLSNLDSNFVTPITIGNASVALGNTISTIGNLTLNNVTINSGTSAIGTSQITNGTSNVTILSSGGAVNIATNGTTAITIDTSQNVGIGTTAPAQKLDVQAAAVVAKVTSTTGTNYAIYQAANTSGVLNIGLESSTGGTVLAGTSAYSGFVATSGAYPLAFGTTNTERMRIDSSGNVGIGVTPSTWSLGRILQVGGTTALWNDGSADTYLTNNVYYNGGFKYLTTAPATSYVAGAGQHFWNVAPSGTAGNAITFTQAMTIDGSGNLLVGTTSGVASGGFNIQPNGFGTGQSVLDIGHLNGTPSGVSYNRFIYNNTIIGSIAQSGTTAVLYNLTSDARLKTNIVDAPLGNIDDVKVRSFDWKSDGSHVEYGFIAQELVEVAPYAVHQPQDPEEMMAIDYSKLVPMMIKEIQDLKQRIKTLENK